ncbi:type II toxin-antitoxin system RelE/ParE family toxin [Clostridium perfringens]|nr:type II toxin-antitoxin system RelE/ParE family toxin [Clostridium perfringens]
MQAKLQLDGLKALETLDTRQLKKKLWEIKFQNNRLMYVIADEDNFYILHACKKQKGKALNNLNLTRQSRELKNLV